jgi:hypothetical protein
MITRRERLTPSGTVSSGARALRMASKTGRPPMVKVGARETSLTAKIGIATTRGNEWLLGARLQYSIDEVAILLPEATKENAEWLECMLGRVGTDGVTYFNRSRSTVNVHSLPSKYEVEYHFFTTAVKGVRLELMRLGKGYSPLHALYNLPEDGRGRDGAIVHASFKVPDEDAYRDVLTELRSLGWVCGQDCSSEYGLFSYWRQPGDSDSLLWLKPRVNLRDGVTGFQADPDEEELAEDEEPEEDYEDEF